MVSPIQLARNQTRDDATVLKANVPEDATALRWSFGTPGEQPIEGEMEGGELQRGVRLRLPGTWKATLQVFRPGGTTDLHALVQLVQAVAVL